MDGEPDGWIRGFSRVVKLELVTDGGFIDEPVINLIPFHGLSPFIKSLRVHFMFFPPSRTLNLVLSFPLLEDLTLIGGDISLYDDALPPIIEFPSPPTFAGSLELHREGGTGPTTG